MSCSFPTHYDCREIKTIDELHQLLVNGANEYNWLFCSTGGVHGTEDSIQDLENDWHVEQDHLLTVLVVRPRLVSVRYGRISVTKHDLSWIRDQVAATLQAIQISQCGNVPSDDVHVEMILA